MKTDSYWLDTASSFTGASPLPVEGRADVVVIGGGFTGLSAARTLAKGGADVRVLEAGGIVTQASGRNGGHCNNGLALDFSSVARQLGTERARELYRAFDSAVDLVEEIIHAEKIDCDFVRSGKLKLAAKPEHFEKMLRAQEVLFREVDADTMAIRRDDLGSEIASARYHGGLLYKRSAMMHMGRFGVGLADAAVRAGARIHQNATVTAIDRINGAYRVSSSAGAVHAEKVLIATGASQNGPFNWFRRR